MALPRLPKGAVWELAFATETGGNSGKRAEETERDTEYVRRIPPRSMAVYVSVLEKTCVSAPGETCVSVPEET